MKWNSIKFLIVTGAQRGQAKQQAEWSAVFRQGSSCFLQGIVSRWQVVSDL
jgi:hypothetical protein